MNSRLEIPTRIVTRPDFDGMVCAVLLRAVFKCKLPVLWVEPNDIERGKIDVHAEDVIANLPYDASCLLWFDHHATNSVARKFNGLYKTAPSAASVIMEYYGDSLSRFSELVFYADKIDSAALTKDEIASPEKHPYIILSMTLTGESTTDLDYFDWLAEKLEQSTIQEILTTPTVKDRIDAFVRQNRMLESFLMEHVQLRDGVALVDTRGTPDMPRGNRFLIYALFPDAHVSVHVRSDKRNDNGHVISVGHSIVNRTCNVHVGNLVAAYGGGGHKGAGSCSIDAGTTDAVLAEILAVLTGNKAPA